MFNMYISDRAIELIGVLATYSITVQELKLFLAFLKKTDKEAGTQTWVSVGYLSFGYFWV